MATVTEIAAFFFFVVVVTVVLVFVASGLRASDVEKRGRVYRQVLEHLSGGAASQLQLQDRVKFWPRESLHGYLADLYVGGFIALDMQNRFVITPRGRDLLVQVRQEIEEREERR